MSRRKSVAFLFFSDGKEWLGGKNYYRSLFSAIDADPESKIRVFAFIGRHADPVGYEFPESVSFIQTRSLDKFSPLWFVDRICKRFFGRTIFLQRALKGAGIEVVSHCDPGETSELPTIAWIPDFQHVHLPHFFEVDQVENRNAQFKVVLDRSNLVVVSSHAARDDLERFSPENADKARVLQFCALPLDQSDEDVEDVVKLYGLASRFFYLPNQFWVHKNHRLAVEALAHVRVRWPHAQIVCSGALSDYRNPSHIKELRALIDELGLHDNFKLLGLITYNHVAKLMMRSIAVINPSFFEGWSTTVEESKAMGAPLLLSDLTVHREQCTVGEALFFAPNDSLELANVMERVLGGDWPEKTNHHRVTEAMEMYRTRRLAFARNYYEIVSELI